MPARPAIEIDVGGTLTAQVAEGTLTSATISIYDENGTITSVSGTAATASGTTLSYTVAAGIADAIGRYRARWSYVVATVTHKRDQLFDVVRAVLRPTLTEARLAADYYGLLKGRTFASGMTHTLALTTAWSELLDLVEMKGSEPNLIIDPRALEPAHAAKAAAILASNFAPGAQGDWQQWAELRHADADRLLTQALTSLDFYDASDDLAPDASEQDTNRRRTVFSR